MNPSEEIRDRTRRIIAQDRLQEMRDFADSIGSYCLFASLHEISSFLQPSNIPSRLSQIYQEWLSNDTNTNDGHVPFNEFFMVIQKMSGHLGISLKRALGRPDLLNRIEIPDEYATKVVTTLENNQIVSIPNLRILFKIIDTPGTPPLLRLHAESDIGSPYSKRRIEECHSNGLTNGIVIEFESIDKSHS
jgi:hypothetical protein